MTGLLSCSEKDLEFGIAGNRGISQLPASLRAFIGNSIIESWYHTVSGSVLRAFIDKRANVFGRDFLTADTANARGEPWGVTVDGPVSEAYLNTRIEREQRRRFRQAMLLRPANVFVENLGAGLGAASTTVEPVNLFLTFFGWPARVAKFASPVFRKAFGSEIGERSAEVFSRVVQNIVFRNAAETLATEGIVELQLESEGQGRSDYEFWRDILVDAGLGVMFDHIFDALKAGALDEVLDGEPVVSVADPRAASNNSRVKVGHAKADSGKAVQSSRRNEASTATDIKSNRGTNQTPFSVRELSPITQIWAIETATFDLINGEMRLNSTLVWIAEFMEGAPRGNRRKSPTQQLESGSPIGSSTSSDAMIDAPTRSKLTSEALEATSGQQSSPRGKTIATSDATGRAFTIEDALGEIGEGAVKNAAIGVASSPTAEFADETRNTLLREFESVDSISVDENAARELDAVVDKPRASSALD